MKVKYDLILVIMDRLMKYVYFLLWKKLSIAENLAYQFQRNIYANHRMSEEIISDRDKLFIFKFWKMFTVLMEMSHQMSIVFHSQMDRQTE